MSLSCKVKGGPIQGSVKGPINRHAVQLRQTLTLSQ